MRRRERWWLPMGPTAPPPRIAADHERLEHGIDTVDVYVGLRRGMVSIFKLCQSLLR